MNERPVTGGCLCGAVRYEIATDPTHVVHCHCAMCRKATGAAFATWVCVPLGALVMTAGEVRARRSSEKGSRGFGATCGSPILMDDESSPTIDVSIGSLDDASGFEALDNIWTSARLEIVKGFDRDLPDHQGDPDR